MTSGLDNYLEALSTTKGLLDLPEGFSTYNATSKSDEVIIKQNNTILQMLLQLFNKLEQIEKRIKYLEEEKAANNKIDELIYKINNKKLDEVKKPKSQKEELMFGTIRVSNHLVVLVEL